MPPDSLSIPRRAMDGSGVTDDHGWTSGYRSRILSYGKSPRGASGRRWSGSSSDVRWERSSVMQHGYPCGGVSRRRFLAASAASAASVPLISASFGGRRPAGLAGLRQDDPSGGRRQAAEQAGCARPLSGPRRRGQEPEDDPRRHQGPRGHQGVDGSRHQDAHRRRPTRSRAGSISSSPATWSGSRSSPTASRIRTRPSRSSSR